MDEQHRQPQPERQHHADRRIALPGPLTQNAEERRRQCAADQCADPHFETGQMRECRSGERQFAGAVHRERHLAHHDERPDQPGRQPQQRRRHQCLLDEIVLEQMGGDVEGEQVVQHVGEALVHRVCPSSAPTTK
jgi:hypothetical protein